MPPTTEEPTLRPSAEPVAPGGIQARPADSIRLVCPYLVAADGGWRAVHAMRDHRCGATLPMAAPAAVKQREVCLAASHRTCATYRAARDLEQASAAGADPASDAGFWPDTRSTVLALEPARGRIGVLPGTSGRHGGQAFLIGLMVLAFLVLVIARTTPPSSGSATPSLAAGALASGSPMPGSPDAASPASTSSPDAVPTLPPAVATQSPSAAASGTPAPSLSPSASARATATPVPADAVRYKVKSGDTLSSLAARFNTTVKKLKAANGITTNVIRVGQVLIIP